MTAGNRVSSSLIIFWACVTLPNLSVAYDEPTHEAITLRAVEASSLQSYLSNNLGFGLGINEPIIGRTVQRRISDGALSEDVPVTRVIYHFHNPLQPWSQAGLTVGTELGKSSVLWHQQPNQSNFPVAGGGSWSWFNARRQYLDALTKPSKADRDQSFVDLFRSLGQGTHLLQDATVPAHVRNDQHLNFTFTFPLLGERVIGFPDDYEKWAARNVTPGAPISTLLPSSSIFTPTNDNQAPVPVARLFDTDRYTGQNPSVLSGLDVGIAEFTNGNFLSKDTIFKDFAYPRTADLLANPVIEPTGEKYYSRALPSGETVTRFVREGLLGKIIRSITGTHPPSAGWVLDDKVHADYSNVLTPRAVGYSASYLDYFFRGKLDLTLVQDEIDPTIVRLEGKNDSPEKLDGGRLELYGDDAQGNRTAATPVGSTTVSADPGQPISASFRIPNDANSFFAIYTGTLGDETPNGDFPGAVIGKVVEGVQVEQLYRDSTRWYVRNSEGVYPTEILVNDVTELQWGDNDNTLVGRSRLGPGAPNLFYAYQINRPLGAINVPLRTPTAPLPDQPETNQIVDLELTQTTPFPLGLNIGTRINFSQRINYKQYLTSQVSTKTYVWREPEDQNPFYEELPGTSVTDYRIDPVFNDSQSISRTYPVVINAEHLSFVGRPYNGFVPEFSLTRDGKILAMVTLALTDPEEETTFPRQQWTWAVGSAPFPGVAANTIDPSNLRTLQNLAPLTVRYDFPSRSSIVELVWVLVDVSNGSVVASTAPPDINISYDKDVTLVNQTPAPFSGGTEFQYNILTGNGPQDGLYAHLLGAQPLLLFSSTPISGFTCPESDQNQLAIVGELSYAHGDSTMSVNGRYRGELANLAAQSAQTVTRQIAPALSCSNPQTGAGPIGFRFNEARIDTRFSRMAQVLRSVPGASPEQLIINNLHFPVGSETGTYHHVQWIPANNSAQVFKQYAGPDDYFMLGASRSNVLVQSFIAEDFFDNGPKILEPFDATKPVLRMTEIEEKNVFLLDPDYLYDADALKFYSRESTPQLTTLPKTLATTNVGNPRGRYHLLRVGGPVN